MARIREMTTDELKEEACQLASKVTRLERILKELQRRYINELMEKSGAKNDR